jgi:3-oxoacyl-[acyl-carrier protein] reductase
MLVAVSDHGRDDLPLRGRVALVTGVSRRAGIGFAIARRLAGAGAAIFAHHHVPHDAERHWGADPDGIGAVLDELRGALADPEATLADAGVDLGAPGSARRLFDQAIAALGHVDVLICNHASSGPDAGLDVLTEEMLDSHWAVNTRSSLLLAQAFAQAHDGRPGGRIVLMTSGQNLGPMPGEIAYAASKGALAAITLTLADELADRGITVNCVNPGPVDTGWATPELFTAVADRLPAGRWGEPDDAARLIEWLVSDDGRWMTGQVLNSEGGFRRWGRLAGGGDPAGQHGDTHD